MAQMGKKKTSEWYYGAHHEDVLDSTLKAREKAHRLLVSSMGGSDKKSDAERAASRGAKIPTSDLVKILRDVIQSRYDDIFDAFTDIDLNNNGRVNKSEFREGIKALMEPLKETVQKFTNQQLDEIFEHMDSKSEQTLRLENFIRVFDPDKHKEKRRHGKGAHKDDHGAKKHTFTEIMMECKDGDRGTEQNIPVKVNTKWEDLLASLQKAFKRPVTFMYEDASHHKHTVKDAKDLLKCWDSVQASGKGEEGIKHLECLIVDFDGKAAMKAKGAGGRPTLKERRQVAARMHGVVDAEVDRNPQESLDFRSRNKWIDDMMRLLGAPLENEPAAMNGKWDILIKECKNIDASDAGQVTIEGFRNALTRTEPRMTPEQVEWFIKDVDKDANGDVLYATYAETKKQGQMAAGKMMSVAGHSQQRELENANQKILTALKNNFQSLQKAFKRMDEDRDGRLSREEFRKGVQQRLKLNLPPRVLDEVIRQADKGGDGYVDYEDFMQQYNSNERTEEAGKHDKQSDEEITQSIMEASLNIAQIFKDMDTNGDGLLSPDELAKGLQKIGVRIGKTRVNKYMASMDLDGNRIIDYREFLRKMSTVRLQDISRVSRQDIKEKIRTTLRGEFDDAKQAFHAFDRDSDGRLSMDEFIKGILDLQMKEFPTKNDKGEVDDEESREKLEKIFEECDTTGDGFLAYHEFLFWFPVRPKPLKLTQPFDQQLRAKLLEKFGNVTEAFMQLDMDGDNRLSREDLMRGLQAAGIYAEQFADDKSRKELEGKLEGLVQRAGIANTNFIDYYDFIVRFGLDVKADGKWVYNPNTTKKSAKPFEGMAERWRALMPKSKWFGRGGVRNSIMRYDESGIGEIPRRQFIEALRDGLMMGEKLTDADTTSFIMNRPWTTEPKDKEAKDKHGNKVEPTINVEKFVVDFLDVYFEHDRVLYDVLLVQNRWLDMQTAFRACSSVLADDPKLEEMRKEREILISKADFAHALQSLVEKSKLTEREKNVIIMCCERDKCFTQEGRYKGYMNFDANFLRNYIEEEMEIYEKVFPKWEQCDEKFTKLGSALNYTEFEQLCRDVIGGADDPKGLKTEQINFLIDVVDSDGDGTVGRSEFVERYAREDAVIQAGLRDHWHKLLQIFHAENKKGLKKKEYTLAGENFNKALQEGLKQGVFGGGKVTIEQLVDLVNQLDKPIKNPKNGHIHYDLWLKKYVSDYYDIQHAFMGPEKGLPIWDAVIASFEALDKCNVTSKMPESEHLLPWDHFRKALKMAGVELSNEQVQKIIDRIDVNLSGNVCWKYMVDNPVAPYFFDGKQDYEMRQLMLQGWPELYEQCKKREERVRKTEKGLLPSSPASLLGALPKTYLEECLCDTPTLNLSAEKSKDVIKKMLNVFETAFVKLDESKNEMKDRNDRKLIDYVEVCRHYAGASFDAEKEFEKKWEVIIEVLKEIKDSFAGRQLSHDAFKRRLSSSELHVSDATIDFLLRGQALTSIDMDEVCWRTARRTIFKILRLKWSLLMKLFRSRDSQSRRKLDKDTLRSILSRADVGMSSSLVEILLQNAYEEDDGKIDYDSLLSGRLKRESFSIEVYVAYKIMESEWERLSQHFWEFDLNGDGRVNHEEFKVALRHLQHPVLTDPSVVADLISHLDPTGKPQDNSDNIDFDKFSWDMARSELKVLAEQRGEEMRYAFRKAASAQFQKYQGKLPRNDAIRVMHRDLADDSVKIILIKILVSRAEAQGASSSSQKQEADEEVSREGRRNASEVALISEEQLASTLREIVGDSFDKAEQNKLRANFMAILDASKFDTVDRWLVKGEEKAETKIFSGAASLGPDVMRDAGQMPLKRLHMHAFLGRGGQRLLESMKPSPALVKIKEDRVSTVYGRDAWITFWQTRANFQSPAFQMSGNKDSGSRTAQVTRPLAPSVASASAITKVGPGMPSAKAGAHKAAAGPDRAWDAVRTKVRKAAFDSFQNTEEALASLDPSNPGAGAIATATLLQAVEALGARLTASEKELLSEKMDPGRDGLVLKSDIVLMLLPPAQDRSALEILAQERHARGIYARLRSRNARLAAPSSFAAPSATAPDATSRSSQEQGARRPIVADGGGMDYEYRHSWSRVRHASVPARHPPFSSQYEMFGPDGGYSSFDPQSTFAAADPWAHQTFEEDSTQSQAATNLLRPPVRPSSIGFSQPLERGYSTMHVPVHVPAHQGMSTGWVSESMLRQSSLPLPTSDGREPQRHGLLRQYHASHGTRRQSGRVDNPAQDSAEALGDLYNSTMQQLQLLVQEPAAPHQA